MGSEKASDKSSSAFLYFAVASLNLVMFACGNVTAWTSSALPILKGTSQPDSNPLNPYTINVSEESLIAALLGIGSTFSPFAAALAIDKLGRKRSLLYFTVPIYVHYVIIYFATTVWDFYIARFLAGLSIGAFFVIVPNYVTELSQSHNRGMLSCFLGAIGSLGGLLFYSTGPFVSLRTSCFIGLVPLTLFYILVGFFVPESSHYLLVQHDESAARKCLKKIRNAESIDIKQEMMDISAGLKEMGDDYLSLLDIFKDPTVKRALFIVTGLVFFKEFSGIVIVLLYLLPIFKATGVELSPQFSSIFIAVVMTVAGLATPLFVDRLGRKFLCYLCGFLSTISLSAIGVFFYFKESGDDISNIGLVPIVSLVVYMVAFNIGYGPISWTVFSEVFPTNAKASASTFIVTLTCSMFSILSFAFPHMVKLVGTAACFFLFSAICLLSVVFVYFWVPETKGKTLREVQQMLQPK